MTAIAVGHAWLQKHPTPVAGDGEFHWYPQDDEARSLRGWVIEQIAGQAAPAIWWDLAPGRLVWAALFSARAPDGDRRSYRGVVLSVAKGDAPAAALWRALSPPALGPFGASEAVAVMSGAPTASQAQNVARCLLRGGEAELEGHVAGALCHWLAELEALAGEVAPARRRGLLKLVEAPARAAAPDAAAELLANAWACAPDEVGQRAQLAWDVTFELARAAGRSCDDVLADAHDHGDDVALPMGEAARRAARPWLRLLHGWGRGELGAGADEAPDDAIADALATELARRALVELRAGRSAAPVLAAARWQALLPVAHRAALWRALARRTPCLLTVPLLGATPTKPRLLPPKDPVHAA